MNPNDQREKVQDGLFLLGNLPSSIIVERNVKKFSLIKNFNHHDKNALISFFFSFFKMGEFFALHF